MSESARPEAIGAATPSVPIPWHTMTAEAVLAELEVTREEGLSSEEAAKRFARYGKNELTPPEKTPAWKMFLLQFNDFMIWVLMVAVAISMFEGQWVEAIAIMAILLLNGVLGFVQEYRAEQALEALKQMSAPTATVIRDGGERQIPSAEIVPGDLVVLEAGDRIPADGRLVVVGAIRTEEAALTGESTPSRKTLAFVGEELSALGDRENMVFSGTSVAVGHGVFVATGTGQDTEIGRIATLLAEQEDEATPLQVELDRVGKRIAILVLAVAAIVFATGFLTGAELTENLLVAISLAVAAIPEGLPAIVTVALSLGVRKMAERNAIVRRLHAVETLGSTSFICSDKTGTLTQNVMTVREALIGIDRVVIDPESGIVSVGEPPVVADEELLFEIAVCASDARYSAEGELLGDPTETALVAAAHSCRLPTERRERIGEIPFDSERKRMSTVHAIGDRRVVYTKGGVDVVLARCTHALIRGEVVELTDSMRDSILAVNEEFASNGNRTLGFAYRDLGASEDVEDEAIENDLVYVGIMAILDPPRTEVPEAVAECRSAGIAVAMVTGDHALTARAIAEEVGLDVSSPVVTGAMLSEMTDDELYDVVEDTHVYARVDPEHKLRIVDALKRRGHIVAMTGDGVNDAPALKKADIGIAMGKVGTDVSREAADMVLADDNFATIVKAVEQGRVVFDNLRKFILFLLSCNVSEVLIIFFATLIAAFGFKGATVGPPLFALQILWINLVTDGLPALALGVDPGDPHVMERRPRSADEAILNRRTIVSFVSQGFFITVAALAMFYLVELGVLGQEAHANEARTMLFTTLVLSQLLHAFSFRSLTHTVFSAESFKNKYLNMAVVGSLLLQAAVIYLPFAQNVFHTYPLTLVDWGWVLLASLVPLVINDAIKVARARSRKSA